VCEWGGPGTLGAVAPKKKQTNKQLFSAKTYLKTPIYANCYAPVTLYFLRTNISLCILPSETLYQLKKEDRDNSEQIYCINKKRHTLLTLGRSSELQKKKTSDRTLWQIAVLYFCSLRDSSSGSLSINWWKQADRTSNCLGQKNSPFQEFDMLSSSSHRIATKQWTMCCT